MPDYLGKVFLALALLVGLVFVGFIPVGAWMSVETRAAIECETPLQAQVRASMEDRNASPEERYLVTSLMKSRMNALEFSANIGELLASLGVLGAIQTIGSVLMVRRLLRARPVVSEESPPQE